MDEEYLRKKSDHKENDIVFSKTIKAGKRIYYLDVKKNKKEELFLAITESKKVVSEEMPSSVQFIKYKMFIYKEEFDKFQDALNEVLNYIREKNAVDFNPYDTGESDEPAV